MATRFALLAALVLAAACTAGSAAPAPGPGPTTTAATTPTTTPPSPSAPTTPRPVLRVVVLGDELAAATGPALERRLEALGTAEVDVRAWPGLGLASDADWVATIAEAAAGADVAVLQFGGRDTPPFAVGPDGRVAEPGSPGWYDRWARQTRSVIDLLEQDGTVSYWVTTPPVSDRVIDERSQAIDLALQSLSHRRGDQVRTIDVRSPFLAPDGTPASTVRGITLRTPDGYGLAPAGAERIAELVALRLSADWCLDPASGHVCNPELAELVPPTWPADAGPGTPDVLVVGDSLLWQAAPVLRTLLESSGARVWVEARPATGLLGDTDWPGRLEELVRSLDPDVTVVQFMGQNARSDLRGPDGQPLTSESAAYVSAFVAAAEEAVEVLTSRGGRVAWVLGPPLAAESLDATLRGIGLGVLGARGGDPSLIPVDLYRALGDDRGAYVRADPDGVVLRLFDGIHYTGTGADRNARAVLAALSDAGCLTDGDICRAGPSAQPDAVASTTTNSS